MAVEGRSTSKYAGMTLSTEATLVVSLMEVVIALGLHVIGGKSLISGI